MNSLLNMNELMEPVDVLVIGGASGGVAAASQAARSGASVALLSTRAYLGEDLCENNRFVELTPFAGADDPLLAAMSAAPIKKNPLPPTIPFTYESDKPASPEHPDNPDVPRLSDHRKKDMWTEGVQYNGETTFTLTLTNGPQTIDSVALMAFQHGYYLVERVRVEAEDSDGAWRQVGIVNNGFLDAAHGTTAVELRANVGGVITSRLRIHVRNPLDNGNVLLSEICVITAEQALEEKNVTGKVAVPYPMTVKRALDAELLDNKVKFLYDIQPVDVLKAADGSLAGVVVADRSGVQYIRAKAVIDATENGLVARLAGAEFRPLPDGEVAFRRFVVGGEARTATEQMTVRKLPYGLTVVEDDCNVDHEQPVWEYTFMVKNPSLELSDMMALEQSTRDMTWTDDMVLPMGRLSYTAGRRVVSMAACEEAGVDEVPVDCLRPAGIGNLLVIQRNADVGPSLNARLQQPDNALKLGRKAGAFAASLRHKPLPAVVNGVACPCGETAGTLRTVAMLHRFGKEPLEHTLGTLPLLGTYDVVVVGGGTGGGPAAIGAVRHGARTLVVEFLNDFGGTCTVGGIARYYYGNICGFTAEMDAGIERKPYAPADWPQQGKSEWLRRQILKDGGEIWTGCICFGAIMDGSRVIGVAVATPFGPGVVMAHTVVDATGNADIAAAAGAECADQDSELGVQGVGLSPVIIGRDYVNTDFLFHDDSDIIDAWRSFVLARERYSTNPDIIQIIGTRERRRIIGDNVVMPMDIYNHRTYPNTICVSSSNFDSHGYTCHPLFFVLGPDRERAFADVPFGAILPKGVDGIEVTGLAVSGHRDTMPILRMQPDIQNHGYAAGCAAAMAAKQGVDVRRIDIKALQRHLVEIGNLPERVLTDTDSYPLPKEKVQEAVTNLEQEWKALSIVMASPETALPMLREAYVAENDSDKAYLYAHVMAMLGDATGVSALLKRLSSTEDWDEGWNFRGMGQYGPSSSPLDTLIIALGNLKEKRAEADILRLAKKLTATSHFSHYRAISLALPELGGGRESADVLWKLLSMDTLSGHDQPLESDPRTFAAMGNPNWRRTEELRELFLGSALYACGDKDGVGKDVLARYVNDGRGIYARHAAYVLKTGKC